MAIEEQRIYREQQAKMKAEQTYAKTKAHRILDEDDDFEEDDEDEEDDLEFEEPPRRSRHRRRRQRQEEEPEDELDQLRDYEA